MLLGDAKHVPHFTYTRRRGCRIVLSQLEDVHARSVSEQTNQSYKDLNDHLLNQRIVDSETWRVPSCCVLAMHDASYDSCVLCCRLADLCKKNELLGVRVMEVRTAYTKEFEWHHLENITKKTIKDSSMKLMREQAEARFKRQLAAEAQSKPQGQ